VRAEVRHDTGEALELARAFPADSPECWAAGPRFAPPASDVPDARAALESSFLKLPFRGDAKRALGAILGGEFRRGSL
jgi:hypothetical protein